MLNIWINFVDSSGFIPHGHCYLWKPWLVWLNIASDTLIALAYYCIPFLLIYIVQKRGDLPFGWIFFLFASFIIACGTGHLIDVWTIWHPVYWISTAIKGITALVSLGTGGVLVGLVPLILQLPSPSQLEEANRQLAAEVRERQAIERELLSSQTRLAGILDIADDAIVSIDESQTIILFNQGAEKIFGYPAQEILGQSLEVLLPLRTTPNHARHVANFKGNSRCMGDRATVAGRRRDGTEFPAEASISRLETPEGVVFTVILRDVSDRLRVEQALRQSERRFRTIFEEAGIAIALTDLAGLTIEANPALESFLGYNSEQLQHRCLNDYAIASDLASEAPLYETLLHQQCDRYQIEKRYRHANGQILWGRSTVSLVRGQDTQSQFAICMIENITECKQAELALRLSESQLRQQAQQLEQTIQKLQHTQTQLIHTERMSSLGQVVAGMAHEINNPINFISGNIVHAYNYARELLELVKIYQLTYPLATPQIQSQIESIDLDFIAEDLPRLLSSMKIGTDRIQQIVVSLRNFSRLDEAAVKAVDLHEGIENTLLILQHRFKSQSPTSAIQVIKNYGNLPLVECYASQLNQVFMNLISNSIDSLREKSALLVAQQQATLETKSVEIHYPFSPEISITTEVTSENQVAIRISDNGVGIGSEIKKQLFDPFFTTKPIGSGTGLGLSISYQIVIERHGGTLECFSELGKGAEFVIQIPVCQSQLQIAEVQQPRPII
ncbi:MAG: PAS domain S-box protein [Desertifilum sp.]|nr:PAS domain S-box protein [Desertifilum sp.]